MRPLYFCANCKQYHTSCKQKSTHQASSVQYLRFSDLFSVMPNPHPQNFTVNSPRAPENSRLVYANQSTRWCHSANKKILIKVNSTKNYDNRPSPYPQSSSKQSRNTTGEKDRRYTYADSTTAKKKQPKYSNNITILKTHDTTMNDLSQFRDKIRTHHKQKMSRQSQMNQTKIEQDQRSGKRAPYYVISKIDADNQSRNSKNQLKISGAQSSLVQKIKSKQVAGSYVYGDSDRKILTSDTKVKQFRYGEPTDSVQDLVSRQAGRSAGKSSSHYVKISLPPKSQPPKIKQQDQRKLNRSRAKNSLYESQQIRSQQMNVKQSRQGGHMDYANKIKQLRTVLKSNQKNYRQRPTEQRSSSNKFDLHELEQSPTKQKKYQFGKHYTQQKFVDSSNISKQQLKRKVKLKIANKLVQHQPNPKLNQIFCPEPQHCKYFDNRCFGLSFCGNDDINYISGASDLV